MKTIKLTPTQEWYARNNGVDWQLMHYRSKEYYRTGTTRAYMRLVRLPIQKKAK